MSNPAHKLPRRLLLMYALPAMPIALLSGPAMASLPNFYVADIGLPLAAVGLALTIARLWDTVADPVVGLLADRTQSRFGRRKPWMLAGLPLLLTGAWFALAAPQALTPVTLMLASIVMYSGWTMIKLSHDAWGAEISNDYDERVRITAWREGAGLAGGLLAIFLIGWGLSKGGPGLPAAYKLIYAVLAGLILLAVLLAAQFVPSVRRLQNRPALSLAGLAAAWRGNAALRKLSAAYFLNNLASALPATLFLAFVIHALQRQNLQGPLILAYSLAALLAVPAWQWAARRVGKHVAWRAGLVACALFFAPVLFLREGDTIWFALICVCTGICLAADLVLPPAIQADVLDADRLASGQDRAGILFAWLGLLNKLGYALAPGLAFPILDWSGFEARADAANSEAAIWVLAALYALAPVVLKLMAWHVMRHFPLDHARQIEIRQALEGATQSDEH